MVAPGDHIMRTLTVLLAMGSLMAVVLGGSAVAQEKKEKSLQLKDLPAGAATPKMTTSPARLGDKLRKAASTADDQRPQVEE
jgi:hypothetical protein